MDGNKCIGTVTESNLLSAVLDDSTKFDQLIEQSMEHPLPAVHMNEEMQSAVKFFAHKVPAVIVTDDIKPIGILTRFDLLDFMSH
jgi:cystathionine beta-synthase